MVNGVSFLIMTFIKVIQSRFFRLIVSFFRAFPRISSTNSNINLTAFKDQQVVNQNDIDQKNYNMINNSLK